MHVNILCPEQRWLWLCFYLTTTSVIYHQSSFHTMYTPPSNLSRPIEELAKLYFPAYSSLVHSLAKVIFISVCLSVLVPLMGFTWVKESKREERGRGLFIFGGYHSIRKDVLGRREEGRID